MDMNLTSIAPTVNEIKRSLHELYGDIHYQFVIMQIYNFE